MMKLRIEWLILGLFCAALLACIALKLSILYALLFGLVLFLLYGKHKNFSWRELLKMALDGVLAVKSILITFLLIGTLTAFWRAAGTIPFIVCFAATPLRPLVFLLMTFLLCCGVSALTGTAFGTAATMGVICATMATTMGVDLRLVGGAILSGVYFGDRCSPVSTSALLVAELTKTKIYDNIWRMLRSALVPFLLTCLAFALLGLSNTYSGSAPDLREIYGREFALHWVTLIPAAVILLMSVLRVNVKLTMAASILSAIPLCLALQHIAPVALLRMAISGYCASDMDVAAIVNGGGIMSMLKVAGIVCLSASYSGIFQKTGLLDGAKLVVERLSAKSNPFAATLCTSIIAGMVACNQTLTVILTHQLCGNQHEIKSDFANDLEDSAIVIAPLIPWSIAGGVPLATVGAPTAALLFACYLYLLPLWRLIVSFMRKSEKGNKTE
jgi:NhaC family Na+:H+ antiporter